jgi:outer membrane protein assembly factor BamD (BamD/ComL family)
MIHPIAKTSIELRRSIQRLENFIERNPNDVYTPKVQELIEDLKSARSHIPSELRDQDIER